MGGGTSPENLHHVMALVGYLFGSIPFGLVMARLFGLGDLRKIGSGNIGATNVLRTGNKPAAFLTLVLDAGKGAIVVLAARLAFPGALGEDYALLAGLAAVVGHNFPVWLRFKGGKGVATTVGTLLAFSWPVGLAACGVWLAVAFAFRYSSLAAIVALAASPFLAWGLADGHRAIVLAALLAVLGIARHKDNIARLLKGEETKIGQKKAPLD